MNIRRAIWGPLLAVVFLVFFAYFIFSGRGFAKNIILELNKETFLGSSSGAVPVIQAEVAPQINVAPEISAKSAISVGSDLDDINKVIYSKAGGQQLPIASLTKLMSAVVVLDSYNLLDTATVDLAADSQAPMKQDVKLGDTMTIGGFLDVMLIGSSNKSAYALAELIGEQNFVALMNKKADDLGLADTFFDDPTGLSPKNVSTANDLVKFAKHILEDYPVIANTTITKELYVPGFGTVANTNSLLGEIPNIALSKTGFTEEAKGCLILVIKNLASNNYLINVVLGADDRFSEMRKLVSLSNQ